MYRKQKKHETFSLDYAKEQIDDETGELLYLKKELLLLKIQELPGSERELFLMKYYLDLTNSEIAEVLGVTKSAVENRLYRGKKKLMKMLLIKE